MRSILLTVCVGLIAFSLACTKKSAGGTAGETQTASKATAKAPANPWEAFGVGSYAKQKMTSVMNMAGKKTSTTSEMKQTLVEKTADKAVVEIETTTMGMTNKTKMDIPLTAPAVTAAATTQAPPPLSTGKETLTVAGKSLDCQWVETETNQGGNKSNVKVWTSSDVPGGAVKMVTKTTSPMEMEVTSELVEFAAK